MLMPEPQHACQRGSRWACSSVLVKRKFRPSQSNGNGSPRAKPSLAEWALHQLHYRDLVIPLTTPKTYEGLVRYCNNSF